MRYFRVVNPDDATDEFYVSCSRDDFELEKVKEHLGLQEYWMEECPKEEYETMTDDTNDYIINVGQTRDNLQPFDSAFTEEEGIKKAKQYLEDWKCVEVVYMPCDNVDINTIVWKKYNK
jgi:hypothetical protein